VSRPRADRRDRPSLRLRALLPALLLAVCTVCTGQGEEPVPGREVVYSFLDSGDLDVADGMLDDCWEVAVGRFEPTCFDGLPTWTEDPYSERYWRFVFYSLRPTRHLLQAWRQTGDRAYLDKLLAILESFVEAAPDCEWLDDWHGTAFRAMVLVNTYRKLEQDGELPEELARGLRREIRSAGVYLADEGHFEGDYNHGLNQAAALLLVAEEFPAPAGSCHGGWRELALDRLDYVMDEIVYADGVQIEMSPRYHFYVLTLAWQVVEWARRFDVPVSQRVADQVEGMVSYAAWVTLPDGTFPLIGSSTWGDIHDYNPDVLETIAALDPHFEHVWTSGEAGEAPDETAVLFEESGQWIARAGPADPDEYALQTHVILDAGPRRTSHAQFDALGLHLYADGRPVLPDSGLYTYESGSRHDYFFGSTAHSTVTVDGGTQGGGPATPGRTASGGDWAWQSGAHELYEGVRHWRGALLLEQGLVLVLDRLTSEQEHAYAQTWQLAPEAEVAGDEAGVVVTDGLGAPLRLYQLGDVELELEVFEGAEDPLQGWHSDEYEVMVPSPTLEFGTVATRATLATLLQVQTDAQEPSWTVELDDEALVVELTLDDRSWQVEITSPDLPEEAIDVVETR